MSWQENRRRQRTWYKHYRRLADELSGLTRGGRLVPATEVLKMFHSLYEQRRLHGKRRIAVSALESLELAARDSGLDKMSFATKTELRPDLVKLDRVEDTVEVPF